MRSLATTAVLCSLVLFGAGWAGASSHSRAKFWSPRLCEQILQPYGLYALPAGNGHHFNVAQAICIGHDGPRACQWSYRHRSRLYSEFTVFARSRLGGGLVRSWTLGTRAGHGLAPISRSSRTPPDFYMSSVTLLATNASPARFRSIVAPIAARLTQEENATGCSG